jgi:hypothetical protein
LGGIGANDGPGRQAATRCTVNGTDAAGEQQLSGVGMGLGGADAQTGEGEEERQKGLKPESEKTRV